MVGRGRRFTSLTTVRSSVKGTQPAAIEIAGTFAKSYYRHILTTVECSAVTAVQCRGAVQRSSAAEQCSGAVQRSSAAEQCSGAVQRYSAAVQCSGAVSGAVQRCSVAVQCSGAVCRVQCSGAMQWCLCCMVRVRSLCGAVRCGALPARCPCSAVQCTTANIPTVDTLTAASSAVHHRVARHCFHRTS